MSLSAMLFGQNSAIHKVTNILGLGIPSLLHKAFMPSNPKMAPQTLGELSSQTAKEGEDRARVYGIGRPIGGNIMYMSQPIKRMIKTYVGKSGGKGGGSKKKKQYQDVEHVYRYYAVSVCEGPITGYRRIWRNGTLVYDARKGSVWGAKNNHLFFKNYRLYTGSWEQMPDSMLQARWGMGIPAHRGTAYLVADNEDLTDFGGAIPQWQFEVARSEGYYLTSRPYAIEQLDGAASTFDVGVDLVAPTSGTSAAGLSGMTFKASLIETVSYGEHKQPLSEAAGLSSMTFKASLINTVEYGDYEQPLSEAAGLTNITFKATLKTQVIDVTVPPESTAGIFNVGVTLD